MDPKAFLETLVADAILVTSVAVTPQVSLPATNTTQVQASLNRRERYDTHIDNFIRIQNLRNGLPVYGYINTEIPTSETFAQFATLVTILDKEV